MRSYWTTLTTDLRLSLVREWESGGGIYSNKVETENGSVSDARKHGANVESGSRGITVNG